MVSRFVFLFVILTVSPSFTVDPDDSLQKIDKTLLDKFDVNVHAEYILLLKNRKVFTSPLPFKTKNEKATYVYQTLIAKMENTQKPIQKFLKENNLNFQSFYVTNAIKVTSGKEIMLLLANRDDVEKIIDNAPFRMLDYSEDRTPLAARNGEPEWGIQMIKADSIWQMGFTGQGVVIAGQDTGYDWDVSPLRAKYRGTKDSSIVDHNFNWHDAISKNSPNFPDTLINPCGYSLKEPCDDNSHGTHTMGIMVGQDEENSIGVSPDSKWIACRNMDRGWGQPATYMECFEWFLAPYDMDGQHADPAMSPHVINNSWACTSEEGCNVSNWILMEEVVKNVKAAGIVVVVSAGNDGNQGCGSVINPPGFFEASFSVGATDREDNIAGFSSRGPVVIDSSFRLKPNVSAPGVGVRSVVRGGGFASFNGTSMAGPHVAGLVALMISANPDLAGQVDIIEDIIEATSVPKMSDKDCGNFLGQTVPNAIFGYGRIDALAAVKRALAFTSATITPTKSDVLSVFPNPADDLITFHLNDSDNTLLNVNIYNMNGRLVLSQSNYSNQILGTLDLHNLPQGMYLYEVKSKSYIWNGKFIKI